MELFSDLNTVRTALSLLSFVASLYICAGRAPQRTKINMSHSRCRRSAWLIRTVLVHKAVCSPFWSTDGFAQGSAELFDERVRRRQIGKTPAIIVLLVSNNSTSKSRFDV
jgi:hypothetical protein